MNVAQLEARNAELTERVKTLEDALYGGEFDFPVEWRLTPFEMKIMGVMIRKELASKRRIEAAIYPKHSPSHTTSTISVHICRLKKKMKAHSVIISSDGHRGYRLDEDTRKRFNQISRSDQ